MNSMKDWADEQLAKNEIASKEDELNGSDFEKATLKKECPFCQSKQFDLGINRTPRGVFFLFTCLECEKRWYIEYDDVLKVGFTGPWESESPPVA